MVVGVPRPSGHVPPHLVGVQGREERCGVAGGVGRGQLDDPTAQHDAGRRWPRHLRPGRVDGPEVGNGSERRPPCAGSTGRIGCAEAVLRGPHGTERVAGRAAGHPGPANRVVGSAPWTRWWAPPRSPGSTGRRAAWRPGAPRGATRPTDSTTPPRRQLPARHRARCSRRAAGQGSSRPG